MNYAKFFKKQTTLIVLAVIGLLFGSIGLTYAVFMQVDTNTTNQVVETGSLIVTYNKGTTLTAQMLPMSNASGLAQAGYSFSVQNTGTLSAEYVIKLHNNTDVGVPNQNNYLAHNQLYISLDGGTPQLISTLTKENPAVVIENDIVYIMFEGLVGKLQTKNHNVKLWIKEDADESIVGKGINLILEVEAVVNESVELTNMFEEGNFATTTSWFSGSSPNTHFVPNNKFGFQSAQLTNGENSGMGTMFSPSEGLLQGVIVGNKYYASCWYYATVLSSSTKQFSFDFLWNGIIAQTTVAPPPLPNTWYFRSNDIVTASNIYVNSGNIVADTTAGVTGQTNIDGIMVIDLTKSFGAGNEPTKEKMDAIVQANGGYWDGTKTVVP